MTSNTSEYGTVTYSSIYPHNGYAGYKVFDKITDTSINAWYTQVGNQSGQYLQFQFKEPYKIMQVIPYLCTYGSEWGGSFKIQTSNNGIDWIDITDNIIHDKTNGTPIGYPYPRVSKDTNVFNYVRFYITSGTATANGGGIYPTELTLYGR